MGVFHIVFIKFKPEATTSERHYIMEELNTLWGVPCVRSLSFGENFTHRSQGYTHALIVGLENKDVSDTNVKVSASQSASQPI
jgi:hypothetical protein